MCVWPAKPTPMKRLPLAVIVAACTLVAATPPATVTVTLPAFSATGTMVAKGTSPDGKNGTLQTQMRVLHRDKRWRIDLLQIAATADDPMMNAFAQLLPKSALTFVADPAAKTLTIWSGAHPLYYQTALAIPKPHPSPHSSASPTPVWDNVMKQLNSMTQYDAFNESFTLTGHQTVNGHMASVYHFTSQMQKHGAKPQTTTGDVAFADDLSGLPLHLTADFKGDAAANVAIDLTQVSKEAPAAAQFVPPAGYKRTTNLGAVLGFSGK